MGGNKATVSLEKFAGASAPRNGAGPAPGPFTSPGESAALTPAQGQRAPSGLLAPARRPAPAFPSPGEAAPPRRRSLLEPPAEDTSEPPRRNDVLPGGFGE